MRKLIEKTAAYKLLSAEKQKNRLHHAYLLVFDDKRNLSFTLKTFAKLLLLKGDGSDDRVSRLIDEGTFADCPIYPQTDKKFTVTEAERVLEEIELKPVEGDKKVFIISDFSEATPQAQNKLLKALEEPPAGVTFLLGASVSYPVLQTILSRTEKLEILPFSAEEVTDCLYRLYERDDRFTLSELSLCGAASGGSVGEAQDVLEGGYYKKLSELAFELVLSTSATLPQAVKKAADLKYKKELLSLLRLIYKDALLLKNSERFKIQNAEKRISLGSEKAALLKVAKKYAFSALLYAQDELTKAEKEIFFNANFAQCLEVHISRILLNNAYAKDD